MVGIIIIIAAVVALIAWACCKVSAMSTPPPCKGCQEDYCTECKFWREWTNE